ncbi:phenylalanine--tRNA ligase subunit beta [Actinoalloteichus sp. AHMU CJ021]|uniref:Phenylalanine--tRNA ligase beta subunit n=1 Tax=Actinoalloteichus caeruleus DSM 43889 TaxID=1120930 RepID=A0ABT1JGI9_ACTCY|nr:phenylalanine--tRNA ligase subunit beta [Actinoalloteichus caeruleus]AUS77682.1 phenylalanine--tRNA ligase subunit beta [Actinoalloteichus sp. AHMU CJ021]MCP2331597.1 phenylalanyl-tRNA synthetase beta subunit [Actinoalloteichus caeruleus DSM 43889]
MRIPVSWLAQHLELPEDTTPEQLADAFVRVGLEVEDVTSLEPVTGPLVIGRVAEIEELTGFKKPIRHCRVEVGTVPASPDQGQEADEPDGNSGEDAVGRPDLREIVCGATNFREGDLVVVALPGTVLPGGFEISARRTYGRTSDGMICSAKELGLGDDHTGILVLPSGTAEPGTPAAGLLGLDDTVIELAITPDRGYCFSVRGLARELSCAFDTPFADPAKVDVREAAGEAWPTSIRDEDRAPRFVLTRLTSLDPTAPTPWWMRRRLMLAGIRSISLAVDVTNYVMLELGQPLHAFDTTALRGDLVVRRAEPGEKLRTLDGTTRDLDPDDTVICDDSGPISLAGVMGGETTEIGPNTTDVLLEAASWEPASIARTVRRHKLPSEAAKRFERSVDPALPAKALERAMTLLVRYGEATVHRGRTDLGAIRRPAAVTMALDLPDRVAGVRYERGVTARRLSQIGCHIEVSTVEGAAVVTALPPTWRPDLVQPADLVEEVLRLEGYDTIPSVLPTAPAGRGLTPGQRRQRAVSKALAHAGYVETLPFPFVSSSVWDDFGLDEDDQRRRTMSLLNPLEADRAELTTTVLPGLLDAVTRNVSRGRRDLALFHVGQVFRAKDEQPPVPPVAATGRPSDEEIGALHAALPEQPVHVAVVLAGQRELPGWWGSGRAAGWADAVEAARLVARHAEVPLRVRSAEYAPWHPGRCAELLVGDEVVGHAGELHPKVVSALGLPARTCAMELNLDALPLVERRPAPRVSAYPPVLLDLALVVDASVPAAEVTEAVRAGAGPLLEEARLFDVYEGEQLGAGKRSLAFALRLRASDRTLTVEEATEARDAAVAAAADRFGATLRG